MKRFPSSFCTVIMLLCLFGCKKHSTKFRNSCSICSNHQSLQYFADTNGARYFIPTAFTPNGDGINDVFRIVSTGLITDSTKGTIWDNDGNEVFNGNLATGWDGTNLSGGKCPAGNYCMKFAVSYKRPDSTIASSGSCALSITLLQYTGTCIKTNGVTYYFPDQCNPVTFGIDSTNEKLCP